MTDPWDQQAGESDGDYALFTHYKAQGPARTYKLVAVESGVPPRQVSTLAARHAWKDRAHAYDLSQGTAAPPPKHPPILLAEDGRDLWDRQPGESAKRWGQFCVFRDLGRTRTLKRAAERLNISHRTSQEYSHHYRWSTRCEAFDRHMDEQWIAAIHERQRRMVQDHLRISAVLHEKAVEAVTNLVGASLNATEATRLAETWSKLIRFALGEPDTSVAVTGRAGQPPVRFSHVPADEAALRAELEEAITHLARKAATTGEVDPYDVLNLPE